MCRHQRGKNQAGENARQKKMADRLFSENAPHHHQDAGRNQHAKTRAARDQPE
jgi:hypothetical protein